MDNAHTVRFIMTYIDGLTRRVGDRVVHEQCVYCESYSGIYLVDS